MLGIVATDDIIDSINGKKVAMKIRKMAGLSPIWNHRMANGIHASGERNRKKLSSGKKSLREAACCPSNRPTGIPSTADNKKPITTRHSDATTSSISLPDLISSSKLLKTSEGEG